MALFKIFNNANTKNSLPTTYNAGYCYFDVNTGKFYIDTTNAKEGRIPISSEMADKLRTKREIKLVGDVTGSVMFDGNENVSITTTVQDDSHTHDTRYLRLTGGTLTGYLYANKNIMIRNDNYPALVFENSSGTRVGSIFQCTTTGSYGQIAIRALQDDSTSYDFYFFGDGTIRAKTFNGNATSANKLSTARTISLTGDVTGSTTFDGSGDVSINTMVQDDSHNHTYLNLKGTLINQDLNDLKSDRFEVYRASASVENTVKNSPAGTGKGFGLLCYPNAGGLRAQELLSQSGIKYIRYYTTSGESPHWTAWKQVAFTTDNVASADKLSTKRTIKLVGDVTGEVQFDGSTNIDISTTVGNNTHHHDNSSIDNIAAEKITSGTISMDRLPQGAFERLTVVADDTARFKLTTANIQLGDVVKVTSTNKMYFVKDQSKLNSEAGYEVFAAGTAASVNWTNIQNVPVLKLVGDATGEVNLAGITTGGKSITVTVQDDSHNHTYLNLKGTLTNEDLNNLKSDRFEVYRAIGGNNTVKNNPIGNAQAFGLFCYPNAGGLRAQELLGGNGIKYIRYYNPENTAWTAWKQVAFVTDNVASASKLANKCTIKLVGDVTGEVQFDGSSGVEIQTTVQDESHYHNTTYLRRDGVNYMTGPLKVTNSYNASNTNLGLFIYRNAGENEYVRHYVDDSTYWIHYTNDEMANSVVFKFTNTDSESSDGSKASSGEIKLRCNEDSTTSVTATNFIGNASTASKWATQRTLTVNGDATGSVTFDGSNNMGLTLDVASAKQTDYALTVNVKNVAGTTTTTTFNGSSAKTINIDTASLMPLTSFDKTLKLNTSWQDLGINGTNIPNDGSYIIQVYINDGPSSGMDGLRQYSEYYTGVMSWYSGNTNSDDTDEIILHKAGHASNDRYIYLRTIRTTGNTLKIQIAANVVATVNSTLKIKVRQLI